MRRVTLNNGIRVVMQKKNTRTTALQITVKTGSVNEEDKIRGISHFIEHMLFEGTRNRTSREISVAIEGVGGEIGAYTTNERTCYYVKALHKHFEHIADVLADMLINSKFGEEQIEKERKVILSEINMHRDEPRSHQWELLQKALFKKHPAKHPVIGYKGTVSKITRKDLLEYFEDHYFGQNIIITVCGNIDGVLPVIKDRFNEVKKGRRSVFSVKEPKEQGVVREKRKTSHSYIMLGYKTVVRKNRDSTVLDLIQSILGMGLSGRLFEEIRNKRGLAYDVGAHNESVSTYGFFTMYANTMRERVKKVEKLMLSEIVKLDNLTDEELKHAKNFIEGSFVMENEDPQKEADNLGEWGAIGDASDMKSYIADIKKVSKRDILRVRDKYLLNKPAVAIIYGE